jgi:hypothetical protein
MAPFRVIFAALWLIARYCYAYVDDAVGNRSQRRKSKAFNEKLSVKSVMEP